MNGIRRLGVLFMALALALMGMNPALALEMLTPTVIEDTSGLAWAEYLTEDDVVGWDEQDTMEFYESYIGHFDDFVYINENTEVGDLAYYVYDPTMHGFDPNQAYPVSIWFHGGGNQSLGKKAMVYGGAATYASDEYQQDIGGMYIIVPIASEAGWTAGTVNAIKGMYDNVRASHRTTDELIVCGTSAGGLMVNRWLEQYAYLTDIVFWMSTTIPDAETVQKYSDMGIHMWFEVALHDETGAYDNSFPNGTAAYDGIENFEYTVFEWARWGNGMIAALGEDNMYNGQHCTCIQVLRNLIQADGTPDDPAHPDGVTGWIRDQLLEIRGAGQD